MQQATWNNTAAAPWAKLFSEPVTDQTERAQIFKRLELLARFLDDAFVLPGTNFRVGWDGLIGLIPGVGDVATTLMSGYIVWEAKRLGALRATLVRMVANLGIDFLVGLIPGLGDLFDVAWKANRRNLEILRKAFRHETWWPGKSAHSLHPEVPQIAG